MANPTRTNRMFDVVVASTALILSSPVMLLIALAILLETGRPLLFKQTRIGFKSRPFEIYKFRKFHQSARADGPLLTVRHDPRMTPLGRLLERTKLDELPQFYNVLKGDMAIVGPRPDTDVARAHLQGEYRALLDYKPGIFGPAQVAFRNAGKLYPADVHPHVFYCEKILPEKARLDLAYYPNRTLMGDMIWTLRGVLATAGLHPTVRDLPESRGPDRDPAEVVGVLGNAGGASL